MSKLNEIIEQIELHSVDGIRKCFESGVSPNDLFRNEPLIYELISEYTRSPRFKDCVKAFIDHGVNFEDKILLSVLSDNAQQLDSYIRNEPQAISKIYSLRCAYTPLHQATLLHICAEFNHVACAEILFKYGAVVNATAGVDEFGFGG